MLEQKNPFVEPIIQLLTNDRYINDIISDYYKHEPNCDAFNAALNLYNVGSNEYNHHLQDNVICIDSNTNVLCSGLLLEKFIDGDRYIVLYDTTYCVNPWDKNSEKEYSHITRECKFFVNGEYISYVDVLSNMWMFCPRTELDYLKLQFLGFRDKIPIFEVIFASCFESDGFDEFDYGFDDGFL